MTESSRDHRRVRLVFQILFWVPLTVCTYLALVPEPPEHPVFKVGDVVLHAAAFVYLSGALVMAQYDGPAGDSLFVRSFVLMIAYGLLLELVQSFIPERSAELKDLLVDTVGIIIGLVAAKFLARPFHVFALGLSARL